MSYQPSIQPTSQPVSSTNALAIVSLVFGILSWCMLPFVGAIVAIICGHLARAEIRRGPIGSKIDGDGLAVVGLVLGYAQLAFCVLALVVLAAVLIFGIAWSGWF